MNRFRLPSGYDGEWLDHREDAERQRAAERYQRKVEEWQENREEEQKKEAR